MKRLLKSRKALSPVVAAIILIAVTVAVSIAVAAWMGALTFTFMKTEELKITGITWNAGSANATIAISNTGANTISLSAFQVDDVAASVLATTVVTGSGPYDLAKGASGTITVSLSWTSGYKYTFAILTTTGNKFTYTTTAAP